ncbi:MAG TPA: hypothetical protein VMV00_02825 [Candidatus Baltobacteraceae bacterium]|nr:hypothetical protein [Candidatus Baltobacteraceae bacterium]
MAQKDSSNLGKKGFRAQSAMEYLMTYGWAILVIAVVLAILFSIGVFSGGSFLGTSCIAASGYLCQNPVVFHTGNTLTFTFGQNTGATVYNVIVGVASQSSGLSAVGFPTSVAQSFNGLAGTSPISTLVSGQTTSISVNLPISSTFLSSNIIGTTFTGYVWVNYSTVSASSASTTAVKAGTLTVKVT